MTVLWAARDGLEAKSETVVESLCSDDEGVDGVEHGHRNLAAVGFRATRVGHVVVQLWMQVIVLCLSWMVNLALRSLIASVRHTLLYICCP